MTMKRIRLNGTILKSERGPLLETNDGIIWKLNAENIKLPDEGTKVIVEAGVANEQYLEVDWIGNAG